MAGQKGREPKARLIYTQLQAFSYLREEGGQKPPEGKQSVLGCVDTEKVQCGS